MRGKKKEVNVVLSENERFLRPVALDTFSWHPLWLFQGVGLHTGWVWVGRMRQVVALKQNSEAPLGVTESGGWTELRNSGYGLH